MLDALKKADEAAGPSQLPFGRHEEEAIIALALDIPQYVEPVLQYLTPAHFGRPETQYLFANILKSYEAHNVIPTRQLLRDVVTRQLTADEPYEDILSIIDKPSNPREVPIIKDQLKGWAQKKAYGLIYSEEAQEAYYRGDYAFIEGIIDQAQRIQETNTQGFWFLDQIDELFVDDAIEHISTGYPRLDKILNNGGPSRGEVLCYMAATNVGKSIFLCNAAITHLKAGLDTMLVTFEMSSIKTALRCIGALTGFELDKLKDHEISVKQTIKRMAGASTARLGIFELPPDECSVNHIYQTLTSLKRSKGWAPKVVIIDYLELMMSRHKHYNKDEYSRQKHVATEVRGLAKNEKVLVTTATQTNRSSVGSAEVVDLNKSAESFGKNMPLDYIVSLNQTPDEHKPMDGSTPRVRMFIAKNRNGPKHDMINCSINYNNMQVRELK